MKFKLNKKMQKATHRGFIYDDKWISNGMFLVEKNLVADFFKWEDPSKKDEDGAIDRFVRSMDENSNYSDSNTVRVDVTNMYFINDGVKQRFLIADNRTLVAVNADVFDVFHKELEKSGYHYWFTSAKDLGKEPLFCLDKKIYIMPMRMASAEMTLNRIAHCV